MKEFGLDFFWKNDSCENLDKFIIFVDLRQLFSYMAFVYAWIVPLLADQVLLQLLWELFDTLPIQCRHIEHMHEGVWFRKNIFLTKLQL